MSKENSSDSLVFPVHYFYLYLTITSISSKKSKCGQRWVTRQLNLFPVKQKSVKINNEVSSSMKLFPPLFRFTKITIIKSSMISNSRMDKT